jgi:hypothetical protein
MVEISSDTLWAYSNLIKIPKLSTFCFCISLKPSFCCSIYMISLVKTLADLGGHFGRDPIVVYNYISNGAYHHQSCEFEPRSWLDVVNATLCNNVCQWLATGRWFSPRELRFPPPIKQIATIKLKYCWKWR